MPMSDKETQRQLDELVAQSINTEIIDLVAGIQEKDWLLVDKVIHKLYRLRDSLRR